MIYGTDVLKKKKKNFASWYALKVYPSQNNGATPPPTHLQYHGTTFPPSPRGDITSISFKKWRKIFIGHSKKHLVYNVNIALTPT